MDMLVKERNHSKKLTIAQVREIRARCAAGESDADLAIAFGVVKTNINQIRLRRTWKFVP